MGAMNKTGVRGLVREAVTDAAGKVTVRWSIDLRYRDPMTGERRRYRERLRDDLSVGAAKTKARKISNAADAGTLEATTGEAKTLAAALDAIVEWSRTNRPASLQSRKTQVKALKEVLGADTKIGELSPFAIERFKRKRVEQLRIAAGADADEYTGAASVNRGLSCLSHACTLWVEWKWMRETTAIALRKVKPLREPPGRVRFLTAEEERALLAKLPRQLVPIIMADMLSGLRRAEIVQLKKADVDLRARELTVTKSKSNKVRRVPINDALAAILETAMARSKSEHVFTNRRGLPYHVDSVTHGFIRARKRAKLENLRLHDCRHHFATAVRRAGGGLDIIMQLLGHAHVSMTMRYAHVGQEQLHDAVARIGSARIAQDCPTERTDAAAKASTLHAVK